MKHKHYDALIAYANGEKIEMKDITGEWRDVGEPSFYNNCEYRVKKEPKVETLCYTVYSNGSIQFIGNINNLYLEPFNLKLTFSDGELISAEVVK